MTDELAKAKRKSPGPPSAQIPRETLEEIIGRLRARSTKLIDESRGLGYSGNVALRKALRAFLGLDGYAALGLRRGPKTK